MSKFSITSLENVVDILDHRRIPVNEEKRALAQGDTPYYGANGLQGYIDGWIFDEPLILMAEDGGYFDEFSTRPIAYKIGGKSWVNNHAHVLRPKISFDFNYVFYCLQHKDVMPFIKGGTRAKLNQKELRAIKISVPQSTKTQKQIAKILNVIDSAVKKTEALIKKYQQIKAGLMHNLFTRGIGADGKLRPSREQAPELYQETKIGWIPKDWDIDELQNLLAPVANNLRSGPFGSALLKHELVEDGIPFLGIDNIHVERFNDHFRRFVSEKKYIQLFKYTVKPRDVVITIMGTVGRCAVVPDSIDRALSSKHLWTITFNEELVIPELVCWQLNFATWVKSWFRKETQGGIMDAIQSKTLRSLVLPIPPLDEQLVIFDRYKSISNKIKNESNTLEKLLKLKSGLMHDLLTGKVSVKLTSTGMEPENG